MKELVIKLINGIDKKNIIKKEQSFINDLLHLKVISYKKNHYKMESNYRVGKIDIARDGTGYLDVYNSKGKDILVEKYDLNGASRGDFVIIKRIYKKGRPRGKVLYVVDRAFDYTIAYVDEMQRFLNVKTLLPTNVAASKKSIKALPLHTVVKIDNSSEMIVEVLGVLEDARVDEKISLALFNKKEEFSKEALNEAKSYGDSVDKSLYPERVDVTHLPFCTIDPVSAKDFDDAIYFDKEEFTLYVAIADASEYVSIFSALDEEAKERGFSIYFPHKSIPMLPRPLSENICSLKPNENRLAFISKIKLDAQSLEPLSEELFEGVIHSQKRYTYEQIDRFLHNDFSQQDSVDAQILEYLLPLANLTARLRKKRLQKGFEFKNPDTRLEIDEAHNLVETHLEVDTPSHQLIEDCMLLANKATAKMFEMGIFRVHEEPDMAKIEELLSNLASIGLDVKPARDIHKLFVEIQTKASEMGLASEVDKLLIKSQKQASYKSHNLGHFGLGFDKYTHFTSPIRRYSDLTLHRLLKAIIQKDEKKLGFVLENIEATTTKISDLEREATKVEWDFMDRKFARWAHARIGESIEALITDASGDFAIAKVEGLAEGARIFVKNRTDVALFDRVRVEIVEVNIATTKIFTKIIEKID